jgi:hypothetical protein
MGKLSRQTKSEFKQLPLLLAKFLGGVLTVAGLSAAVFLATRSPGPAGGSEVSFVLLGVSGLVVFILSSRALATRKADAAFQGLDARDRVRLSVLSWMLLLVFAALFLAVVLLVTRSAASCAGADRRVDFTGISLEGQPNGFFIETIHDVRGMGTAGVPVFRRRAGHHTLPGRCRAA